uniref:Uncharacterized protein n=1 Tax=Anguilla anguilla TaxID=7936 RepID=A0A0E9T5Y0_ANGAN
MIDLCRISCYNYMAVDVLQI